MADETKPEPLSPHAGAQFNSGANPWPTLVKPLTHLINHLIDIAHTKLAALLVIVFIGVFLFKMWRGDEGDIAKFEAIIERSDQRNQRFNELNFKIMANAVESVASKVDRNTVAVEANTAQIVKSIAGRVFTTPQKKAPDAKSNAGVPKPPLAGDAIFDEDPDA